MNKPTHEELFDEDGFENLDREDDTTWRHGSYVKEWFRRIEDETFWLAQYYQSTDGETNELRDGGAIISHVEPYEVTVIRYRMVPADQEQP